MSSASVFPHVILNDWLCHMTTRNEDSPVITLLIQVSVPVESIVSVPVESISPC